MTDRTMPLSLTSSSTPSTYSVLDPEMNTSFTGRPVHASGFTGRWRSGKRSCPERGAPQLRVVVAPGRVLRIRSLVSYVLVLLLLGVVAPRVSDLMSQVPFSLLEVLDKDLLDIGAMVGTAPTSSRCRVVARQG